VKRGEEDEDTENDCTCRRVLVTLLPPQGGSLGADVCSLHHLPVLAWALKTISLNSSTTGLHVCAVAVE
jgi:hypothetical protein